MFHVALIRPASLTKSQPQMLLSFLARSFVDHPIFSKVPMLPYVLCFLWALWVTHFQLRCLPNRPLNLTYNVQSFLNYQNQPAWEGTSFIAAFFKFQWLCILLHTWTLFCLVSFLKSSSLHFQLDLKYTNWVHHFLLLLLYCSWHTHHQSLHFLILLVI